MISPSLGGLASCFSRINTNPHKPLLLAVPREGKKKKEFKQFVQFIVPHEIKMSGKRLAVNGLSRLHHNRHFVSDTTFIEGLMKL